MWLNLAHLFVLAVLHADLAKVRRQHGLNKECNIA
jgi:hypothetical protein